MKSKLLLCLALVLSGILLGCSSIALGADIQFQVSSDFPGGSAKVLKLDPASNTVGNTPAGDPKRGWKGTRFWPCAMIRASLTCIFKIGQNT